jgi:hypothetical protein
VRAFPSAGNISLRIILVAAAYYVDCSYRQNEVTLRAENLHITLIHFEAFDEAVVGKCSKSIFE